MDYIITLKDLPTTIRALTTINEDGIYVIVINSRFSYEQQRKSLEHEIKHINSNDFEKLCADQIEYAAHKNQTGNGTDYIYYG